MRKILLLTLLFSLIVSLADAQHKRRRGGFYRKKPPYRYELIGSLGVTNFLGDLGGADQIGTHGFKDLEFVLTRPAVGGSMRWKMQQYFSVKGNLFWGILKGDDKLTKEPFRNNRNLNFKSNIFELTGQVEFNFIKEQKGHIYKIKGVRGMAHKDRQIYLFAGGGGVYFNPKGKYLDGKWYALQPFGTEGQGLPGEKKKYVRITSLVTTGAGARFALNRYWGVGMELGMRWSHSDFMDDVSDSYHTQEIKANGGSPKAIYFADPSQASGPLPGSVCDGCQRGDVHHKDAYMFAVFTVGYKVMYRKRSRSKF
ncbi:MAG: hypothetical protein HY063_05690 [Bacteroidetes bacterium]|nr:hypothetical protein [Bacteroidota bacterium]